MDLNNTKDSETKTRGFFTEDGTLLKAADNDVWQQKTSAALHGESREEQIQRMLKEHTYLMRKVRNRYGVVEIAENCGSPLPRFVSIDCDANGNRLVSSHLRHDDGFSFCVLKWFDTSDEAYAHLRKRLMEIFRLEESDWKYCTPQLLTWGSGKNELDNELDYDWWERQGVMPTPFV